MPATVMYGTEGYAELTGAIQANRTGTTPSTARSSAARWAGRLTTAVAVLFLLFDSTIKLLQLPVVHEAMVRLGYPVSVAFGIGVLELACILLYLVPRTCVLGAVLLTGFLGGAIATHVRVGDPIFSHVLFPVYIAALLWLGLYLRDQRLRAFVTG